MTSAALSAEGSPTIPHVVESAEQAAVVLEYFNGFHDGFIRRLGLISHDIVEDRDTHVTSGPPFDQLVQARFSQVRELHMSVTGQPTDWPITNMQIGIEALTMSSDPPRLRARLIPPRLIDNSRWEHVEVLTFSFHSGEFHEMATA